MNIIQLTIFVYVKSKSKSNLIERNMLKLNFIWTLTNKIYQGTMPHLPNQSTNATTFHLNHLEPLS